MENKTEKNKIEFHIRPENAMHGIFYVCHRHHRRSQSLSTINIYTIRQHNLFALLCHIRKSAELKQIINFYLFAGIKIGEATNNMRMYVCVCVLCMCHKNETFIVRYCDKLAQQQRTCEDLALILVSSEFQDPMRMVMMRAAHRNVGDRERISIRGNWRSWNELFRRAIIRMCLCGRRWPCGWT
jgi:hypothetical protein